jgi:hypothetical protein
VNGKGTTTQKSSYAFLDQTASSGKQYYRLKQIDLDGAFKYSSTVEVDLSVPETFSLSQNYPNPFNPATTLSFGLPVESEITLAIYNSVGELVNVVAKGIYQAGNHSLNFNATNLTSGVYYYSLKAVGTNGNEFVKTAKMLLMK